jgi:hypothetical protein
MKKLNLTSYAATAIVGVIWLSQKGIVHATTTIIGNGAPTPGGITNQSGIGPAGSLSTNTPPDFGSSIMSIANTAIGYISLIAGILAVAYLIWSGIQYIISAGNPEKAKLARQGIINAIIGIIIIVAAYTIIRIAVAGGITANNTVPTNSGYSY